MTKISLSLTASQARKDLIEGSRTVVIDVLRATSVIVTALENGAKWVIPVAEIEEARKKKLDYPDAILGGERNAVKISGFDNGNSPLEYSREKVEGRGVILTTTNGTKALGQTKGAGEVLICALINLNSVVQHLAKSEKPVHILCAGTNGEFSMDDFLCAGGIISELALVSNIDPDDISILAKNTWEAGKNDIQGYLSTCKHYNVLKNNGFSKDLDYCLSVDNSTILPVRVGPGSPLHFARDDTHFFERY